ncbi:hypothetical protein N9S87_00565 [Synechococcus sp. AH-779-G23]|nr:hypothetical protein [Synechococcus sp. AH-779-G23]MDA9638958.1 hypothetical protein [Synechococcus sp. AH-779-G23]
MGQPVLAIPPLPWANQANSGSVPNQGTNLPTQNPSGRLREVEPPGAVQQLHQALAKHHPQLSLISPLDGSQLLGGPLNLELKIEDWPVVNDIELGLGAHVAIQIDGQTPIRLSERNGNRLTLELPPLSPGSHRFTAYAAYPWGEAVKTPGASLHWSLDQLRPLMGSQPKRDAPWLAVVSPAELGSDSPLLLDWLVWNAPLQNLKAGDARWRLRISVNEDSFVVDQQDALWLQGIDNQKGINTVQMELLNGIGESLEPMFNNQLRAVPERQNPKPIWLRSSLNETELARLLGETKPEAPSTSQEFIPKDNILDVPGAKTAAPKEQALKDEAIAAKAGNEGAGDEKALGREAVGEELAELEALETSATRKTSLPETALPETAMPEMGVDLEEGPISKAGTASEASPEPSKPVAPGPQSPSRAPIISIEPERISPTSTLGGSARELLNPDGTQR